MSVTADYTSGDKATELRVFGDPEKPEEDSKMIKDEEGTVSGVNVGIKTDGDPSEVRICIDQAIAFASRQLLQLPIRSG